MIDQSGTDLNRTDPNRSKNEMMMDKPPTVREVSQSESQHPKKSVIPKVAAAFLICYQILVAFLYGFLMEVPASTNPTNNVQNVLEISLMLMLVIVGFGLIFGYYHSLGWTAIGFPLFITAVCIETYFLFNGLFSIVNIHTNQYQSLSKHPIFLSANGLYQYEGTLRQAIKCSLSCVIAFSAIIGRVGIYETFLLSIFGTAGYEISRVVSFLSNNHDLGTFKIFGFGAAMGLMISLCLKCNEVDLKEHPKYTSTLESRTHCLVGLCLYIVLFPLLVKDDENTTFTIYQMIPVLLSIVIATMTGITFSYFYGGFMTILTLSLAGGIGILSAAPYLLYPYLGLVVGIGSALLQYIVYAFDKCLFKRFGIIDNFRFVFVFQAAIGTLWGLLSKAVYFQVNAQNTSTSGVQLLAAGWMCIGIGLGVGLVLGIMFSLIVYHYEYKSGYYFVDKEHWNRDDGIRNAEARDSEIDSVEEERKEIAKKYQFWDYSKIKQTHSIL